MEKINQGIGELFKKSFWLSKENKKNIEAEAKKKEISESALVRHIINNWFAK